MNQLIELITKLAQSVSAKFTELTTKLSNGAFVVDRSKKSEQLVGGANGKTYTVNTIDGEIRALDKNVDIRIETAKTQVSTEFSNQLSGLRTTVDAELAKKATKDELNTFKSEVAQTTIDLKKADADNLVAAKTYTDEEVAKVAGELGSFKKDVGGALDGIATTSKAYTDQQIDSILSINQNGVIDTIKEIVEVIGTDKNGIESLLSQLSKKASAEDFKNLNTTVRFLDVFARNTAQDVAATNTKVDTLGTRVDTGLQTINDSLFAGFSDAIKTIDAITIEGN